MKRKAKLLVRLMAVAFLGFALAALGMPLPPCAPTCCGCCSQSHKPEDSKSLPDCGCVVDRAVPAPPETALAPPVLPVEFGWIGWADYGPTYTPLWPSFVIPQGDEVCSHSPPREVLARGPPCVL